MGKALKLFNLMLDVAPDPLKKRGAKMYVSIKIHKKLCSELKRNVRSIKGVKVISKLNLPPTQMHYK